LQAALKKYPNPIVDKQYTGVSADWLQLMPQVEEVPMLLLHTYPTNEIVLIWIAKEANFSE
jgi:hypothetical protein